MKFLKGMMFVALSLAAVAAPARTLDEIKKEGKIVIASEGYWPPFNYFEGSKLTGFEIDLGDAIAKKLGVNAEWKALSFDALLPGLGQDRWDLVLAGFAITEERAKSVTFASPHVCTGGVVVAKNPTLRTVKDLAGRVVAVQTGTTNYESVKKVPGVKDVKNFPQDTDARSAVIMGRADVWVTDKFVAKASISANPGAGLTIGDFVFIEKLAPVVKKGNASLEQAVNKALTELVADGTYGKISNKYFGEDVRCR